MSRAALENSRTLDDLFGPKLAPEDLRGRLERRYGVGRQARFFSILAIHRHSLLSGSGGVERDGLRFRVLNRPGLGTFLAGTSLALRLRLEESRQAIHKVAEAARKAARDKSISAADRQLVATILAAGFALIGAHAAEPLVPASAELLPRVLSAGGWWGDHVPLI